MKRFKRRRSTKPPAPRYDVLSLVKEIASKPFSFKVRSFEVVASERSVFFMVEFDRVDPCARHELERHLTKKGFDVHGGATSLERGGGSDISFGFKVDPSGDHYLPLKAAQKEG